MSVPTFMRAAVLGQPGEVSISTKPLPTLGAEDVLVRVSRVSLCGTDLKLLSHAFFGDRPPKYGTFTPGHEYAGVVAATGSSVDEFKIGDRVVTEAHRGCMRCTNCLGGAYTDCLNYGNPAKGHRTVGMTVDGGLAEYVVNHVSTLHLLPPALGFDEAVALTTAGTVMHALDVLRSLVVGARVAVIGPGPIGLLTVQSLKELGAEMVALIGTRDERLAIGTEFGADLVVNTTTDDVTQRILDATSGQGVDFVLECSGAPTAVDTALRIVKRSGSVVLVGFFGSPVTADLNRAVMNGVTIHTVRGEGNGSIRRAITLASQGKLNGSALITHHFKLDDVAEAYRTYADRSQNAIKVIIDVAD